MNTRINQYNIDLQVYMDDQFFQQDEYQQAQQGIDDNNTRQQPEDPFGQAEQQNSPIGYNRTSNPNIDIVDDQLTTKIRQEQEAVQDKLRQKADQQYNLKQQRRRKAKQELDSFINQKQEETQQRKQQNIAKQKQNKKHSEELSQGAGWLKVSESVSLKMGDQKGSKDVNRMRQAIVNKRNDSQAN